MPGEAVEKQAAELVLEPGDASREGRLGNTEFFGGSGERSAVYDRAHGRQVGEIHASKHNRKAWI